MHSPRAVQSLGSEKVSERERLLGSGVKSYGSTVTDSRPAASAIFIKETVPKGLNRRTSRATGKTAQGEMEPPSEDQTVVGYRRLTATTVHLPIVEKWYRRIVIPGITSRSSPYSNVVHTTKYTVFNFIFKNIWEQLHRFANIYFLFIVLLNFVPAVEVFGKEVAYIPLLFVVSVTAVKDIFEDYRRYRSDKEVNTRTCRVYDWEMGTFVVRQWQRVRVGDFIELTCDEVIPADILLLHSTESHGICYIETANIDGETNLKQRQVKAGSVRDGTEPGYHQHHFKPADFQGELFCEQPHNRIYDFNGYVVEPDGTHVGVNRTNLLLRGCALRNTSRVAGMVVYAGHETKALLNNSGPRAKRSKLERDINGEIISQVVILFILCLTGAIGTGIWTAQHVDKNIVYFPFSDDLDSANPFLEGFIRFWTFVILYQVIIPISLYISMEIVKFIQVYFINWDRKMYYAPTDRPFQCRALNINEDLGQIQYIFSDKTGTLTENQMVFRCCSIGGRNYAHTFEAELAKYSETTASSASFETGAEETDFPQPPEHPLTLDSALTSDMRNPALKDKYIHDFFVTMAICNTVVVSRNRDCEEEDCVGVHVDVDVDNSNKQLDPQAIVYEAESPDEAALVEAARSYGYTLISRSSGHCTILTPGGKQVDYDVLHILEFDPNRKCMSVLVREKGDSEAPVVLYSKGADSVIYTNLAHTSGLLPAEYESLPTAEPTCGEVTQDHLNTYARQGLRTLCLARRILTEEEYSEWLAQRHAAETSLEHRDKLLSDSAVKIEQYLELLGATGIEDRLQDGVPEAVEALRVAGLKLWVLTGDKQETAVNIGYSSRLIEAETDVIPINASSMEECREILEARQQELDRQQAGDETRTDGERASNNSSTSIESAFIRMRILRRPSSGYGRTHAKALVIDGDTLEYALQPSLKLLFLDIAKRCRSVICCRVAPLQKAAVVDLVKRNLKLMTLAVGDGANDVSMIQRADVGVGIAGREGMQAVMASDFAMARFRFLERLLLVHGHWCYSRLANMMLYFFYKNVAYATLLFWFQLFNGFTGSAPIDGINLIVFNLAFTSLPILVVGITDQDLRPATLLRDKCYYDQGRCSKLYTRWKFWLTMLDAFYQSAAVFFVAYGAYYLSDVGLTEFGFVINITMVLTISLHLAIETLHWTVVNHIVLWGSVLFCFLFNYVYTSIDTQQRIMDTYWLMTMTTSRALFWFVFLLAPMIALFPRIVAKVIEHEVFPSPVMKARIRESLQRRAPCVPKRQAWETGTRAESHAQDSWQTDREMDNHASLGEAEHCAAAESNHTHPVA